MDVIEQILVGTGVVAIVLGALLWGLCIAGDLMVAKRNREYERNHPKKEDGPIDYSEPPKEVVNYYAGQADPWI